MKRFIKALLIFLIPALLYSIFAWFFLPDLLRKENGPSTLEQLQTSFKNAIEKDYDLLILGNSRMYRGVNPDYLSFDSYNFSHDNDSYNQIYHKLNFLLEKNKEFDYLILGLDYFQFSFIAESRNYAYADFLSEDYINDFENGSVLRYKLDYHLGKLNPEKALHLNPKKITPFIRDNGQYIKDGLAKENDNVKRNMNRLDFQVKFFKKTLALCKYNNIKVVILTLPTRQNELDSYSEAEIAEFNNFIMRFVDGANTFYLNYSYAEGFNLEDYSDITHFNEKAANKFSKILDQDLHDLLSKD